ncbi:hypothetical protein [Halomonas rhizosphaerae]|uniref:DUF202 domain-containing protein n=1 Tax=Halomonas rhizosphaerae TaxID=3043296 RepID=A0ABT6V0U8_9GAMM|nr:hypothetical protein [Halomonas rhizosphaerae]MDI5891816.1 hypothetical protein [Halomonas rhizosphaerae]
MALTDQEKLSYAWNWFEYHAAQRLLAFRYFLVFIGILLVAYNSGLDSKNLMFASATAYIGSFVSLAFLVLEFRNEELVNIGREALKEIEHSDSVGLDTSSRLRLLTLDRTRSRLKSHKLWLRIIYVLCIVAFFAAGYWPNFFFAQQ